MYVLQTFLVFLALQFCESRNTSSQSFLEKSSFYIEELQNYNSKIKNSKVQRLNSLQNDLLGYLMDHIKKSDNQTEASLNRLETLIARLFIQNKQLKVQQHQMSSNVQRLEAELSLCGMGNRGTCNCKEEESGQQTSKKSRLLIVPIDVRMMTPSVYHIENGIVANYSLNFTDVAGKVDGVTYDDVTKTLYLCHQGPNGLYKSILDSNNVSLVRKIQLCFQPKVDEVKRLLFLVTFNQDRMSKVSKLNIESDDLTMTHILDGPRNERVHHFRALDIDRKKEMIYVSTSVKLLSMTYTGSDMRVLRTGYFITSVGLHPGGEHLYFNTNHTIMRFSLSDETVEEKGDFDLVPWNIQFYNESHSFVSVFGGRDRSPIGSVYLFTPEGSSTPIPIATGIPASTCLIP